MPPSAAELHSLKRRVYIVISAFIALVSLIGIVVYTFSAADPVVLGLFALSALYHVGAGVALYTRRLPLKVAEPLLIAVTTLTFFGILARALYDGYPDETAQNTVLWLYLWWLLLYLFCFLSTSARRALFLSLGIFAGLVALTVPHALNTAVDDGVLGGSSALGNLYFSHIIGITVIYFLATFQQRSQRAEQAANLMQRLAFTDDLTGVANRRQMEQLIGAEIARDVRYGRPFSVVLVDIDNFKQVNDTYGHDRGDVILKELVTKMRGSVRASDRVGRWGGEEFLILAPETRLQDAVALAEHVRERVAAEPLAEGHRVTVSLGAAAVQPNDTVASLVKRADDALYRAKEQGKDCVVSEAELVKKR